MLKSHYSNLFFHCACVRIVFSMCSDHPKEEKDNNRSSPPRLSYSGLATNRFDATNLIGKGAFGSVYRAVFSTGENGIHTTVL